MLLRWLQRGMVLACATVCAVGQKNAPLRQTTPASVLMHIDEKAGEVFYHDRNDKLILLDFAVNGKTVKPVLKPNEVVLVTYVNEGSAHVATAIQVFSAQKPYPLPGDSSGNVGGVATLSPHPNALHTNSSETASGPAIYTEATTYSAEGALAMRKAVYDLLDADYTEIAPGKHLTLVSVRQGITFTARTDPKCNAVNVVRQLAVVSGCQSDSGTLVRVDWEGNPAPIQIRAGSRAYVDDITVEPEGLGLLMSLPDTGNTRYISNVWIPFRNGKLPAQAALQERLSELIETYAADQGTTGAASGKDQKAPTRQSYKPLAPAKSKSPH